MLVFSYLWSRSWTESITLGLIASVLYFAVLFIYRLCFSPIARFPGPKLAAATLWYEFYYEVILDGRYQWKIRELHAQYGPIIRISPFELHVDDPEFYDELYVGASVRKTDKYKRNIEGFGGDPAAFSTYPHALHRVRRTALNPFFSKKSVAELTPAIQAKIDRLCERLEALRGTGAPVNMVHAYSAFTVDVITEYMFARSLNHLEALDFDPSWHEAMVTLCGMFTLGTQFPQLVTFMRLMPEWFVKAANPSIYALFRLLKLCGDNIEEVRKGDQESFKTLGHRTIFQSLIYESALPPEEKTTERLQAEGVSLTTAGSITTAHFLTRATYELLANPSKLSTLRSELQTASSQSLNPLILTDLESLPYLSAVVNETHRLTYGVPHRLMRISPDEPLHYKPKPQSHTSNQNYKSQTWIIPPGTPVAMSSLSLHDNPTTFPSPRSFIPERWLQVDEKQKRILERSLIPFSRGSRQCTGMNLASAEICLTLYKVFGPGGVGAGEGKEMRLFETDRERDVEIKRNWFNPFPGEGSRGVRVLFD